MKKILLSIAPLIVIGAIRLKLNADDKMQIQETQKSHPKLLQLSLYKSPSATSKDPAVRLVYQKVISKLEAQQNQAGLDVFSRKMPVRQVYHLTEVSSKQESIREFDLHYVRDVRQIANVNPSLQFRYYSEGKLLWVKDGQDWVHYEEHPFLRLILGKQKQI